MLVVAAYCWGRKPRTTYIVVKIVMALKVLRE